MRDAEVKDQIFEILDKLYKLEDSLNYDETCEGILVGQAVTLLGKVRRKGKIRKSKATKLDGCDSCNDTGTMYACEGVYLPCELCDYEYSIPKSYYKKEVE